MAKHLSRILIFVLSAAAALTLLEAYRFIAWLHGLEPAAAWIVGGISIILTVRYLFAPLASLFIMPVYPAPSLSAVEESPVIARRLKLLGAVKAGEKAEQREEIYRDLIRGKAAETEKIRSKYVRQVFFATMLSQNGLVDAVIILTTSVRLCREVFIVYGGRAGLRDLLTIGKHVYHSILIGGSEISEYILEELTGSLAKGLPFIDRIAGSVADGMVNAALMIRVSKLTENYCSVSRVNDMKDLYPGPGEIYSIFRRYSADLMKEIGSGARSAVNRKSGPVLDRLLRKENRGKERLNAQ